MPDFGDFDDDDAFAHEPADPEQVARKLHQLRQREGLEGHGWDDLDLAQQTLLILVAAAVLRWLVRQGAL